VAPIFKPRLVPIGKSESKPQTLLQLEYFYKKLYLYYSNRVKKKNIAKNEIDSKLEKDFRCIDTSCGGDFTFFVKQLLLEIYKLGFRTKLVCCW